MGSAKVNSSCPPHGTAMTQGFHSFDHPVRIDSFQPHGHLRLRSASLEIFYPETGRTEIISMISNWSATWHQSHIYEADVAPLVPTGAVLVIKQWYDNTEGNPNNPDPDQVGGWGQPNRGRDVPRVDRHNPPRSGGLRQAHGGAEDGRRAEDRCQELIFRSLYMLDLY